MRKKKKKKVYYIPENFMAFMNRAGGSSYIGLLADMKKDPKLRKEILKKFESK